MDAMGAKEKRQTKPDRFYLYTTAIPFIILGVAAGLRWPNSLVPSMLTLAVFLAVLASFTRKWKQPKFWLTFFAFLALHVGVVYVFLEELQTLTRLGVYAVGSMEAALISLAVAQVFGGFHHVED
jgi:hypothetical protein